MTSLYSPRALQNTSFTLIKFAKPSKKAGLKLNNEKCRFSQAEVEFLGLNISAKGIKPINSKIDILTNAKLSPWPPKIHGTTPFFIPKDLASCKQVWVKCETSRPLQPIYDGPFEVIKRSEDMKTLTIFRKGKHQTISVDKVKAAHVLNSDDSRDGSNVVFKT